MEDVDEETTETEPTTGKISHPQVIYILPFTADHTGIVSQDTGNISLSTYLTSTGNKSYQYNTGNIKGL